ncbi:FAD-dependent oxidoreductase [Simiduia agarivorans]|uniref:Fumarate reductase flavoprotein subunit n=1 Tax=Simiduia agarivorans (strain DSM 21679 / JCM 13881 / BCRC 17597 / SA1) TaxID=1117647 RepID=K4KHI1_SIMAS|nr:FAD-dependent oxidoreductase [Simiduia agarivorans]AFU98569.1 fumarate reductase flavoprotein subunit [Simiduia agarivorans SA1 = DSM 21679]
MEYRTDNLIIGGGVAGLVAALELARAGRQVTIVDRDTHERIGGLARWAFGGMALVGTPEQRRMGVPDTPAIAYNDWASFAEFSQYDHWPKAWAQAYVQESRPVIYDWLRSLGLKFMPAVNWVERGLFVPGNSLPRYHVLWGAGLGLVEALLNALRPFESHVQWLHQHTATEFIPDQHGVVGVTGVDGEGNAFRVNAQRTLVATGGINGSVQQVIKHWPAHWGKAAQAQLLNGAHPFADGQIHERVAALGGRISHVSDMWNYAAGVSHPRPHFDGHGLSLIPCKSALWLDEQGDRLGPVPLVTGFDTNFLCEQVSHHPHTWQLLNWHIAAHELAVSGAEHNPAIRDHKLVKFLWQTLRGNHALVQQMLEECEDFLVADSLDELVAKMQALTPEMPVQVHKVKASVAHWDQMTARPPHLQDDDQIRRINHARAWRPDRLRTVKPAPITDPRRGPLIAIRCRLISRKSLGGIQTDLHSRVLTGTGEPIAGLYAIGEAAGFGGGGASGKRSLEGTFLAGCVLTARKAAQHINEQ